jgi:hypothetical protein
MSDSATSGAWSTDSAGVLSVYVTLAAPGNEACVTAPATLAGSVTPAVVTVGELAFGLSYISAEPTR